MQMKSVSGSILAAALVLGSLPAAAVCPGSSSLQCHRVNGCPAGAQPVGPPSSSQNLIQSAIDQAQSGEVLCVAPGTYTGSLNFKGKDIVLRSSGGAAVTFLNGGGTGIVVTFNHFEGGNSVLDGFTIQNGSAPASAPGGGGLLIVNASPTIKNCVVRNNTALGGSYPRGGGAYIGGSYSAPSITCTRFEANRAGYAGGGLATTYFAHPYLGYDSFVGNSAPYGGGLTGHFNGRATIEDSEILANSATDGGGIHLGTPFGNATVRRTVLARNTATGNGGGMWVAAGFADVLNDIFDANRARTGGAAAAGFGSMVNVASTIFVNNVTTSGTGTLVSVPPANTNTSLVVNFSDFFNNIGGNAVGTLSTNPSSLLSVNPNFATGAGACYSLQSGSPLINAGIPNYHFNDVTPSSSRNDMGIYGGK